MVVLGLDVGGANVKAATADNRAWGEPFALWKNPTGLTAVLAEVIARFPDAESFAVTMTGELCDCFETKREGVSRILAAVESAAAGRAVQVWSTAGRFVLVDEAQAQPLKIASANWHALATYAGRFVGPGVGLLIDIGSTTTDLILLGHGGPIVREWTDPGRLRLGELVYTGVRRTPVFALVTDRTAAEFFATTHDVYLVLGLVNENAADTDTADGRPATVAYAKARLAHVLGGDAETVSSADVLALANRAAGAQRDKVVAAARDLIDRQPIETVICSGSGEFLARAVAAEVAPAAEIISLADRLGPRASACAPAFACAVLAAEAVS
jgi:probable H4MPT-linked C1 transfer pathway protein